MLLIFCLIFAAFKSLVFPSTGLPCQVKLQCPDDIEITFAAVENHCHIFANPCELRNENCYRHNIYFKTLQPISHAQCKRMCEFPCTEPGTGAFCGYSNQTAGLHFRSFHDYCEWNRFCCQTKIYYRVLHMGPCDEAKASDAVNDDDELKEEGTMN